MLETETVATEVTTASPTPTYKLVISTERIQGRRRATRWVPHDLQYSYLSWCVGSRKKFDIAFAWLICLFEVTRTWLVRGHMSPTGSSSSLHQQQAKCLCWRTLHNYQPSIFKVQLVHLEFEGEKLDSSITQHKFTEDRSTCNTKI